MSAELLLPSRAIFNPEQGVYDLDWSGNHGRKCSGSYYTPSCLVDSLLDRVLEPLLKKTFPLDLNPFPSSVSPIPLITLCDPACGTGHFLVAAARRIARRLAISRSGGEEPTKAAMHGSLAEAIEHCIYGVDIDASAVELCKLNLWMEAGKPAGLFTILDRRIRCGDSLFFPWDSMYPEIFMAGGFDAAVGNPPFVNAIEGAIPAETKMRLAADSGELSGTADLAFHFVKLSHELVKSDGRVGLVLPKTFLNAESAAGLRDRLLGERPPSMIHIPRKGVYFPGASAYTCLVVLGGERLCSIADEESPGEVVWRQGAISHSNWWRSAQTVLGRFEESPPGDFVPLGEQFEVTAGMTTADAYDIKRFLCDDLAGSGLKLVTTGLIDPFACKWGQEECRYLGSRYAYPRVVAGGDLSASLSARLHKAATRPKLLVAGLCNRFEAFFDREHEYMGAVSTYCVYHPADDEESLESLCNWLNSPPASELLRAELGAASVGGGFMTLKKKTLKELPIPKK